MFGETHFSEAPIGGASKEQPGLPLVRVNLKTRPPATAEASIFACLDRLAHVSGLCRVSASEVTSVRRNLYLLSTPTRTHRATTVHLPFRPLRSVNRRFLDNAPA